MGLTPYYDHAGITLYHGDCREILPQLTETVDLVLTDPPYGVNLETHYRKAQRGRLTECRDYPSVYGDDVPFDPSVLLSYPNIVTWGAQYYADKLPAQGKWLVWDKRDGIAINDQADCELAWTRGAEGNVPRIFRHLWNGMLKDSERDNRRVHPTQKPIVLMAWCMSFYPDAQTVLDPFLGSGTTAVAAKKLGRRCIGIEINEGYLKIAVERLRQEVLL